MNIDSITGTISLSNRLHIEEGKNWKMSWVEVRERLMISSITALEAGEGLRFHG